MRQHGFSTRAIHLGYDPYSMHGSLTPPIHVSSTYAFPTAEEGGRRFAGESEGYIYSRLGSPGARILEQRMASLEGAEAALVASSGMGAITSLMWTLVAPGDEIVTDHTLYGCTFKYFGHALARFGVSIRHVDLRDPNELAKALSDKTKVVYFETPANPNMRVVDIAACAALARDAGALTVVDNTYMTPYLQRPIELGADFVVHSATKYLGGHGDLIAGVVCGKAEAIDKVRYEGMKDMTGAVLGGFDVHLLLRGIKTLALRMERHCDSAEKVAAFLASHPAVETVHYPGLPSDPGHEVMARQARRFGAMIAVNLKGGKEAGIRFINRLDVFTRAVSLGDCESLAEHPASMTHSTYTPEEQAEHYIGEGLIRLSVGLEDVEDLLGDLEQALA
jgi:methionine-gamma-lyase